MLFSGPEVRRLNWTQVPVGMEPSRHATRVPVEHQPWSMVVVAALLDLGLGAVSNTHSMRRDLPPIARTTLDDQLSRDVARMLGEAGIDGPDSYDVLTKDWWAKLPPNVHPEELWSMAEGVTDHRGYKRLRRKLRRMYPKQVRRLVRARSRSVHRGSSRPGDHGTWVRFPPPQSEA